MTDRPYFNESTAALADRIAEAKAWFFTLHEVYVELSFRERKNAKELRASLAALFAATQGYFPWPTTDVGKATGTLDEEAFPYEKGLLGYVGYRVGKAGASARKRQALLDDVFTGALPKVNSPEYMSSWGPPGSAKRLKKLAHTIASFVKTHRLNDPAKFAGAIAHWESDLVYLKGKYCDGKFSFHWPEQ